MSGGFFLIVVLWGCWSACAAILLGEIWGFGKTVFEPKDGPSRTATCYKCSNQVPVESGRLIEHWSGLKWLETRRCPGSGKSA